MKQSNRLYDNSIYRRQLNKRILVLVPHEDDEINTCGNLIRMLADARADISIVFSTNGDWKYTADVRMRETAASARVLGIPSDKLFFLGYGDSFNNNERTHMFYTEHTPSVSAAGHSETYGTAKFPDYAFQCRQEHSAYTKKAFIRDLISVILKVKADWIICTDFDEHPDHRMLTLSFDRAIGIIRRKYPEYKPEVWKRFAYALAYTAVADYSAINNPETKKPSVSLTEKYAFDLVGSSIYKWEDRIRIPVIDKDGLPIWKKTIGKALLKHKSQYIITHADRILNSDEVYWGRRTDGISYDATIETSSGNGEYLNDFMLNNVCDIDSPAPEFKDYYWKPEDHDKLKMARFTWNEPQTIEQIVLYGSMDDTSQIDQLQIRLSNNQVITVSDVPNNGNPVYVNTGHCEGITSCELAILNAHGNAYGLSECEFYPTAKGTSFISPFLKILINDNFAYEFVLPESIGQLNLGLYCMGVSAPKPIQVITGKSRIENDVLHIDPVDRKIILRVEDDSGSVWDQVIIKICSSVEWAELERQKKADEDYLRRKRRFYRVHNMLFILKHQGALAVLRRTKQNGIVQRNSK